jgi:hypothetical protein
MVELEGVEAIELVAEVGRDPLYTVEAILLLKKLGAEEGLPFLRWVEKEHYNRLVRKRAKKAIARIVEAQP